RDSLDTSSPASRQARRAPPAHRPPPSPAILRGATHQEPSPLGRIFGEWFDESPGWLRTMVTTLVGATLVAFAYGAVILALRLRGNSSEADAPSVFFRRIIGGGSILEPAFANDLSDQNPRLQREVPPNVGEGL